MAKQKSRHDIEVAKQKELVRKNLEKIKTLMNRVETLYNKLPRTVQGDIFDVHPAAFSLNHCIRWGVYASENLLEPKPFRTITKNL